MRLCVIGDPVGHSLSPLLHRRMLDRAGLTGSYETVTVTPDTLPEFLAAARDRGLTAIGGMELLVQQAILAFSRFTGTALDRESVRRDLLAMVEKA